MATAGAVGSTLVGIVALILLVGSSTVGTVMLLGSGPTVGPGAPPLTTPAPPPTSKPTTDPSVAPPDSGQPGAHAGSDDPRTRRAAIGDIHLVDYNWPPHTGEFLNPYVMLEASDWGYCYVMTEDIGGYEVYGQPGAGPPRPDVCRDAAPYDCRRPPDRRLTPAPSSASPRSGATEAVTRYEPGYAESLPRRDHRSGSPAAPCFADQPEPGHIYGSRVVQTGFAGDESLLIYIGTSRTEEAYPGQLIAVVRVGDTVAVVEPWIDLGSDHDLTVRAAQRAATKLGG